MPNGWDYRIHRLLNCKRVRPLPNEKPVGWDCRIHRLLLCIGVRPISNERPVGWDCRIHLLFLCRGVRHRNEWPGYYTKHLDGEIPVMLKFCGIWRSPILPALPCPLWSGMTITHTIYPYYLPIAGGRIIGFIPFPRVLVLCEMELVSSRIWTRVAVSISYDDNDYTTGTYLRLYISLILW